MRKKRQKAWAKQETFLQEMRVRAQSIKTKKD
jgi:hypothetical protein